MSEQKRLLTIHFMDGTRQQFMVPRQVADAWGQVRKLQMVLDRPQLCVETSTGLVVYPMVNIKSLELSGPAAEALPEFVVRGATPLE